MFAIAVLASIGLALRSMDLAGWLLTWVLGWSNDKVGIKRSLSVLVLQEELLQTRLHLFIKVDIILRHILRSNSIEAGRLCRLSSLLSAL